MIVNIVAIVMFLTAIATPHWAEIGGASPVNTGLFQSCVQINRTCYDTSVYFDAAAQKGKIMASAVINVFAMIGMFLFFALSIFFLCGLFEEKQLATGAVITAYASGVLGLIGVIIFAVTLKDLSYNLGWSFVVGTLGIVVDLAAGVLMCVGRNLSTRKKRKKKKKRENKIEEPVEQVQMDEQHQTKAMKVWSSS